MRASSVPCAKRKARDEDFRHLDGIAGVQLSAPWLHPQLEAATDTVLNPEGELM